jgi:uncharacterized protein YgiM (DUF1202 family)
MASGRLFLAATLALSTCAALPAVLRAEDSSQSESDAKRVFTGEVNANSVFVRSRASEDAYPTMKLSKGMKVTVVGIKGQWLKIEPPDGSFAYVPKSFVIMRNDGTVGRMNREWIAKAGSELNDLAAQPLATVHDGEDVHIIGQHNEYFKIKPPKESYLWINKQFVDPVKEAPVSDQAVAQAPEKSHPSSDTQEKIEAASVAVMSHAPTTRPADQIAENVDTTPSTTQPAASTAIADYQKLEDDFATANLKSIAEQPLPDLLAGYQKVIATDELPSSMRSIAEIRVATLKVRNDAREKFLAIQDSERKSAEKRQALAAERQEIEDRIKKNDIQIFAAVGTLRPSSLQVGQGTLYRLTDPATGRTVAYVRTNDSKYVTMLGLFIGVRGSISNDPQLRSIIENPVESIPVEPSKVNRSVAAQIVPPSLIKFTPASPSTQPSAIPALSVINESGPGLEPQ